MIVDRINQAPPPHKVPPSDNAVVVADFQITQSEPVAVYVGLDGWHLTRAQLDAFPDPKLAHDRRGAHWTFDGEGYVAFVQALREPELSGPGRSSRTVYAPSFSHEKKDPVFDSIPILSHHRLVIIEGLYTFLSIPPWSTASELLDERWWVEISEEEAEKRLVARHVKTGVAKDLEEAIWRSRENDAPSEFSNSSAMSERS